MTERLITVDDGPDRTPRGSTTSQSDLAVFIPVRLGAAYRNRRAAWTATDTAAAWLLAGHLLLLLVIVGRGSLFIDDLRAQGYALDQPFLSFVGGSNHTHFAPLPRILDWVQSRAFPLQHGPAVTVTLLVRLLLALGFWRVLRRLFGPRPAILVPFTLLLLTPALLSATTYYRQSITVLACTAAIVWAVDAQLRWVLYRRATDLVLVGLVTAIGLGCFEKAAAIPVILLVLTLAVFTGGPRSSGAPRPAVSPQRSGRERPVRAGLLGPLVAAGVVLVFLVIYRSGPYDQGPDTLPSGPDVLRLTGDTVSRTVIPLLLGGPFHWTYSTPYAGEPLIGTTAVAFSLVIVLVALAVTLWRDPGRTGRALLLLAAWTLPSVAIVAAGRYQELGLELATATRLWADLVPGFLLAGTLAVLPWRVGGHAQAPARDARDRADTVDGPLEVTVPALAGGLVLLLVLGGSVFSSLTYAGRWWDNPTGQWIANARLSLENAEPYPRTLATPLPATVMPSFVSLAFPTDAPLLLLLRPDIRFHDGDGETRVMDAAGVRSAYLPGVLAQTPAELCAADLTSGRGTLRFPVAASYQPGAQIELGLLLAGPTRVAVTMTTADGEILTPQRFSNAELTTGPHTLRVPVPYLQSVRSVTARITETGTGTSCVAYAKVWAPLS